MKPWWLRDPGRLATERGRLAGAFPSLSLELSNGGDRAQVSGVMLVIDDRGYSVTLEVPAGFPRVVPILFCKQDEIPWKTDRHLMPGSGKACLCAPSEYRIHWPGGSDLTAFLERLVRPFFVGQLYYDDHGCWPPTGQRSHGRPGIIESYGELLTSAEAPSEAELISWVRLIARKNHPKGHERCPCGSGLLLRDCHRDKLTQLRKRIDHRHAEQDLQALLVPITATVG